MQKLKMQTPNKTDENIQEIAKLFPHVMSEKNGKRVVDFDLLRQVLSGDLVEADDERYRLDWVGKKASLLKANTPITKTLRPCKEESVDFENTQNLYIEGDNFEVLKLIQESYLNKIKMIYIDPPYNTGKDFVYRDNFTKSKAEHESDMGLRDEEENKLFKNTDSNGRFHSDWLSMMYERLLVSRDLLKEDGVIFISIDDNEVHNLRKICDEVFGEGNFVAQICHKARASISNDKIISSNHNHILCYAKSYNLIFGKRKRIGLDPDLSGFDNPDDDERGAWKLTPVDGPGGAKKGNPYYEFLGVEGYFRYSKITMEAKYKDNLIVKTPKGLQQKFFLSQAEKSRKTDNTWWDNAGLTSTATRHLQQLMDGKSFDTPKPIELIQRMLKLMTFDDNQKSIILDFFSGSATTAHAVMQLNAEDGGSRKHICVQLQEETDEKSEAYKAGYKTIPEIGKERIRRAGKKIVDDNKEKENIKDLDIGFRVLKIDSTNFKEVYYHPDELGQGDLLNFETNIKEDRTDLDLLFQTMLDLGVELSLKITPKVIDGVTIYMLENKELVACFADDVSLHVIEEIKTLAPYQIVLKDSCFSQDKDKINAVESLSKISTVSVI